MNPPAPWDGPASAMARSLPRARAREHERERFGGSPREGGELGTGTRRDRQIDGRVHSLVLCCARAVPCPGALVELWGEWQVVEAGEEQTARVMYGGGACLHRLNSCGLNYTLAPWRSLFFALCIYNGKLESQSVSESLRRPWVCLLRGLGRVRLLRSRPRVHLLLLLLASMGLASRGLANVLRRLRYCGRVERLNRLGRVLLGSGRSGRRLGRVLGRSWCGRVLLGSGRSGRRLRVVLGSSWCGRILGSSWCGRVLRRLRRLRVVLLRLGGVGGGGGSS
jgi:hypothetical protein